MNAQSYQRRAAITGGGSSDRGKCTVEVVVDGAAEVEIRGDSATLRNLSGQPPQWRRFECTSPLTSNPTDFRFAGVDGRGKMELVRDARNGGVAIVRIEDPSNGAEAYTFDVTWSGGNAYPNGSGYPNAYPNPANYPNNNNGSAFPSTNGNANGNNRDRQFTTEEAVRVCQDSVREQAAQRFNAEAVTFLRTTLDDEPGRQDWVVGTFTVRGGNGRQETHRFSCSVNFDNGRVRSAQIDPVANGVNSAPVYGDRSVSTNNGAIDACGRGVEQRLRRDGYDGVNIASIRVDPRTGRNNRILGTVSATGEDGAESFDFSCVMNLQTGAVRSVNVVPR